MNKIQALEKTIYNLENDVYPYGWEDVESCNCGILARTLLKGGGVRANGFGEAPMIEHVGTFSRRAHCLLTGISLPIVFQKLKNSGFTFEELCHLEYLSDRVISEKAGIRVWEWHPNQEAAHGQFHQKKFLIAYLKPWVEILKEQEVKEPEPVHQPERTRIVYVSVPETIKKQAEQLITN